MIDDECERIEQLLGLAFVAAQTFVTTVKSHLLRLSNNCKNKAGTSLSFISPNTPNQIFRISSPLCNSSGHTEIEVINAVANYWKHHEEWPTRIEHDDEYSNLVWDVNKMTKSQKSTAEIVVKVGISPSSTGNLRDAFRSLCKTSLYDDLSAIRKILRDWAYSLHEKAQSEVSA